VENLFEDHPGNEAPEGLGSKGLSMAPLLFLQATFRAREVNKLRFLVESRRPVGRDGQRRLG